MKRRTNPLRALLLLIGGFFALLTTSPAYAENLIRLGILANDSRTEITEKWQESITWLEKNLSNSRIQIVPLTPTELEHAVSEAEIELLLTSTEQGVQLQHHYRLHHIATLTPRYKEEYVRRSASVIIARSDSEMNSLTQIKGKRLMALAADSVAGYLLPRQRIERSGVSFSKDIAQLTFSGLSQQKIVKALLSGTIDIGLLEAGVLERMADQEEIDLRKIRVLGERQHKEYPFVHSTMLIPNMPLMHLDHLTDQLVTEIHRALMLQHLEQGSVAWSMPDSLFPIEDILQRYGIITHKNKDEDSLLNIFQSNRQQLIPILLFSLAIIIFLLMTILFTLRRLGRAKLLHQRDAEQLIEMQNHLQLRVDDRTKDLIQSQNRLEQAEKAAKMGHWERDLHNNTLFWSPELYRIFNQTSELFIPTFDRFLHLVHPQDRQKVQDSIRQSIQDSEEVEVIYRLATTEPIYLKDQWLVNVDSNNTPISLVGVTQDISEAWFVRLELQMSQQRLEYALEASRDALWDWNITTGEFYLSHRWFEMTGQASSQDPLQNLDYWYQSIHPEDITGVRTALNRHLDGLELKFQIEHRIQDGLGDWSWVMTRGKIVERSNSGQPKRVVGIISDIHETKMLELRLKKHLSEQKRIRLATLNMMEDAQRARENAEKAKQDAVVANRTKSLFLATMSHEIRTPMNGVLGMAEVLVNTPLTGEQQQYLDTILSSGQLLTNIINDLLDFSKLEAGQMDLVAEPFMLEDVAHSTLELIAPQAIEKNISLYFDYQPDTPYQLIGDANRLRQILINLLGNAIKFTQRGSIHLNIISAPAVDGLSNLLIEVIDSGIGIEKEKQSEIFDYFIQVDQTTTRRYGGTGLGLAISRSLASLMQGTIEVESDIGQGSKFTFHLNLPFTKEAHPLEGTLIGQRIIIAHPDSFTRKILSRQLKYLGIESRSFTSATAVIQELRKGIETKLPFEALIIDPNLKVSDRNFLCQYLLEQPDYRSLKQLLVTPPLTASRMLHLEGDQPNQLRLFPPFTLRHLATKLARPTSDSLQVGLVKEENFALMDKVDATILLVEDVKTNQMVAKTILNQLGYEVILALDGKQAVTQWLNHPEIDLIFMDCRMPVMDGYQATQQIRQQEREGCHIPIIALTANAAIEDRQHCISVGMDDIVTKPIKRMDLEKCLHTWLKLDVKSPDRVSEPPLLPASDTEIIDLKIYNELSEAMEEEMSEVISLFATSTQDYLEQLDQEEGASASEDLVRCAHSIKSSSASLGAIALSKLAKELEREGGSGKVANLKEKVSAMKTAFKVAIEQLNRLTDPTS